MHIFFSFRRTTSCLELSDVEWKVAVIFQCSFPFIPCIRLVQWHDDTCVPPKQYAFFDYFNIKMPAEQ